MQLRTNMEKCLGWISLTERGKGIEPERKWISLMQNAICSNKLPQLSCLCMEQMKSKAILVYSLALFSYGIAGTETLILDWLIWILFCSPGLPTSLYLENWRHEKHGGLCFLFFLSYEMNRLVPGLLLSSCDQTQHCLLIRK